MLVIGVILSNLLGYLRFVNPGGVGSTSEG